MGRTTIAKGALVGLYESFCSLIPNGFLFSMKKLMIAIARYKNKVFNSIIISNSVYVVDVFRFFKFSTNFLFHKISMFKKSFAIYSYFPISCNSVSSTFPVRMIYSQITSFFKLSQRGIMHSLMRNAHFKNCFFRVNSFFSSIPRINHNNTYCTAYCQRSQVYVLGNVGSKIADNVK